MGNRNRTRIVGSHLKGHMLDKFRDECGVFGIYGHSEASKLAYLGFMRCSIAARKALASPPPTARASAPSVRWATSTTSSISKRSPRCQARWPSGTPGIRRRVSKLSNAQPIVIDCVHGQVAVCHNGNIVNANEIRERLVKEGSIFQTNSDTECWCTSTRDRGPGRSTTPLPTRWHIGAFSFAILVKDHLIAARDPHGVPAVGARPPRRRRGLSVQKPARSISSTRLTCAT